MSGSSVRFAEFDYLICQHGGDVDAAFDELESFIQELQDDMVALDRQTRRQDAMAVASIAYRLKSSAKLRGIDLLHQSAIQIEQSARRNRMGQLNAEIDLMRYQVELLAQSAYLQKEALSSSR
ncbi:MAG: Hpt domain-containing protein [Pirellula sp.]|jgi:HPt (histidine-containing phosphotransfer) domain-containing protein|nr:Hpt domain-containing protein [Pirellula sp.]